MSRETVELRAIMKFLFLQKQTPEEIHECLTQTLGDKSPSFTTVKKWCANFQRGDFETHDEVGVKKPSIVSSPEIVDNVHDLILADRRISTERIAEALEIPREGIEFIIHEQLGMRKLSTKWVPKCLNADQKRYRVNVSKLILQQFQRSSKNILDRLVTVDETWLHYYDQDTRQQFMQWRHPGSPQANTFKMQKSAGKVMATFFWDKEGILLTDYLQKGQTLTADYYSNLLCQLKEALQEKRRGKLRKGVFFLQDNAPAHRTGKAMDVLKNLGFEYIDHLDLECIDRPPYSPDLAPSDYFLFPNLKRSLKGMKVSNELELIAAAEKYFSDQTSDFFLDGLKKLEKLCAKCVLLRGDYVE